MAHLIGKIGGQHLVVRLEHHTDGADATRRASVSVAQRALDVVSVMSAEHAALASLSGAAEHITWWTSKDRGRVMRYTCHSYLPSELITEPLRERTRAIAASIPPDRLPSPPLPPDWHPSFRHFRAAQLDDDLTSAFRHMYLAVESILGTVAVKQASETESDWLRRSARLVLDTPEVERRLEKRFRPLTAHGRFMQIYRLRLETFHSKDPSHLPFFEDEATHRDLQQAFVDLSDLYLTISAIHLDLDRRAGTTLFQSGFDLMTRHLLGVATIYVSDDDTPPERRVDDKEINPRGAANYAMHTRNARKLEGPFERVFIGKSAPSGPGHPNPVHGWTLAIGDLPIHGGTFEGALDLDDIDCLEIVISHAYRRDDLRTSFTS
ncbi:hypothetical protein [Actinomarinicola tropica]|uniref:Uncharacterized protein n=1 Tax=Actinomarinicola tropica TaxID=2789776 RepID=A0A5Q2RQV3_9ACTN|nr:hypothetical protein [Actinomarinicola tropica]QGG96806.1 hypothetical protein GH723_17830 [Actinomarinicola tropica]